MHLKLQEEWLAKMMTHNKIKSLFVHFVFTRSFTFRRFFNLALIHFQKKIMKNSFIMGYPYKLYIDPSSICNLHCPLCPAGQRREGRSRGVMKFETFKRIIDELSPYLYEISIHNWGEPLVNNDFFRMVRYAHDRKIKTVTSSNLNLLNEEKAEKIVRSGLDWLTVSIDGASPETYSKYRMGGDFNKVIENIKLIQKKKKELGRKNPIVNWQFLVMRQNEHEIEKARKMAKELGIEISFDMMRADFGKEIMEDDRTRIKNAMSFLPLNEKYSRYDYKKMQRKIKIKTCPFLWTQAAINWNGSVAPCCAVWEEKYDFGNINEQSFKKIWNNKIYIFSRELIAKKGKVKNKSGIRTICANCLRYGFPD